MTRLQNQKSENERQNSLQRKGERTVEELDKEHIVRRKRRDKILDK
jgi:hypothetical protein